MHPIDIDEAKEYLKKIKELETVIHNKITELQQFEILATSITAPTDREAVQTSGISDKVGEGAAMIADLKDEIKKDIVTYLIEKSKRIKVIEYVRLQDFTQYNLLFKHYAEYKHLTVVASELKLSYPYVLELHREALKKVAKILKNQKKPM